MQMATSPVRNDGSGTRRAGSVGYNTASAPTHAEKEMIVAHVRRLMAEAEDFFVNQQHLLKMTYEEVSRHIDQLKYRAQFFVSPQDGFGSGASSGNRHNLSVPMPLTALAAAAGGGFPFGAGLADGASLGAGGMPHRLHSYPQQQQQQQRGTGRAHLASTAPLHNSHVPGNASANSPHFSVSPLPNRGANNGNGLPYSSDFSTNSFQVSGSNNVHGSGAGSASGGGGGYTYSASAVNLVPGTSTPPGKHLKLTTDSKSPSLATLHDDNLGNRNSPTNDWGSLSLANNTTSSLDNTQSMMASPQFTNTLSLDDLLARFVGTAAHNDSIGGKEKGKEVTNAAGGGGGSGGGDGTFSFDTLYEQLIRGEKSKSPDSASNHHSSGGFSVNGMESKFDVTSGKDDRFAAMGFAVTAGEGERPSALSGVPASGTHNNNGGGLAGGSLFERNATAGTATDSGAADRFNFDSAAKLFSTATGSLHTPTKPSQRSQRQQQQPSPPCAAATPSQHQRGSQQQQQHADPAATPYALLNSFDKKDVIPIDSIRSLCDHHLTQTVQAVYEKGRPKVEPIAGSEGKRDDPAAYGIDLTSSCQVLVEFKRKRVLQYDSDSFVPPGKYVVVGGDRGEDLGLVIYTWCEVAPPTQEKDAASGGAGAATTDKAGDGQVNKARPAERGKANSHKNSGVVGIGLAGSTLTRSIGVGNGTVLRLATDSDVVKLLGVQAELETRAVDVCSQRVLDHALPMVIVDAEYQFDKKKLTFFYEAQQRMDFRDLVRDLYKTFRARIWMELVDV